jgi:hypothetical protein
MTRGRPSSSLVGAASTSSDRHRRIFVDPTVDEDFATHGYCVLPDRLSPETVREFASLYRGALGQAGRDDSGRFRPSMMIQRADLRRTIWDGVGAITRSALPNLFVPGTAELFGGSFVSKPSGSESGRDPHQDPTTSDERRAVSLSLWIPLIDSSVLNGTVHVLPGSHRMGNHVRPPDVDSLDPEVRCAALEDSVPIEIDAGSILVIDGALIHHSPPNRSSRERIAAIAAVRSVGAAMRYVRSDHGRPTGVADVFEVPVERYRSQDLVDPDLGDATLLEQAPYQPVTMSELRCSRTNAARVRPIRSLREARTWSGGSPRRAAWRRRIARR